MLRSELVARIAAQNPHLTAREAETVVSAILGRICDALAVGDRVELRDFGTFAVHQRKARASRNPRTGAPVAVAAKTAVHFRPGKGMRARLNLEPEALAEIPRLRRAS